MLKFEVLKVFVFVYKSYKVGSKSESKYRGGKVEPKYNTFGLRDTFFYRDILIIFMLFHEEFS